MKTKRLGFLSILVYHLTAQFFQILLVHDILLLDSQLKLLHFLLLLLLGQIRPFLFRLYFLKHGDPALQLLNELIGL